MFGTDAGAACNWHERAIHHFDPGAPGRNFQVTASETPVERRWAELLAGRQDPAESNDECCLDFLTPLPVHAGTRTRPDLARRRGVATGDAGSAAPAVRRRSRVAANPRSAARLLVLLPDRPCREFATGAPTDLNGCLGPLLLRGEHLGEWWPWLVLCEEIGLGGQIGFGQGLFRLHAKSVPILDARLTDPKSDRRHHRSTAAAPRRSGR